MCVQGVVTWPPAECDHRVSVGLAGTANTFLTPGDSPQGLNDLTTLGRMGKLLPMRDRKGFYCNSTERTGGREERREEERARESERERKKENTVLSKLFSVCERRVE